MKKIVASRDNIQDFLASPTTNFVLGLYRQVMASQPNILTVDNELRRDVVIDMAMTSDGKIRETQHETLRKYQKICPIVFTFHSPTIVRCTLWQIIILLLA